MKKINKITSLILIVSLLFQLVPYSSMAAVPEINVVPSGEDGFIHLSQYVQHVEGNIFKVSLTMQPQIKPNGGDFVILIDANENMLKQKTNGATYFEHALEAAYTASQVLLSPSYNPLQEIGVNQNRVWIIFYNGQAYNTNGAPLITGKTSTAFCYISDDMYRSPASRNYPGTLPPASQLRPFSSMQETFSTLKANLSPLTSQPGLFNTDITADKQRYTAVGLAAAYDVFADFSGEKAGQETNRKVVMLLSNGPDYERDDAFAIDSDYVPQEGSMRMEALFISKALKFQTHAYDSSPAVFGSSSEGNLKAAALSIASSSGNTYFKNLPANNWTTGMPQYDPYGNALPLPVADSLSESVISLDTHKITVGQAPEQMNPFALIHYDGLDYWTNPFSTDSRNPLYQYGLSAPKAFPATTSDSLPTITDNYQYVMFGDSLPLSSTMRLSQLNSVPRNESNPFGPYRPREGYPTEHGRNDGGFYPNSANFYSVDSHMYTYADHNQLVLKDTYNRIASEGGMSAEIWSIGLFVGNSSNNTNPGVNIQDLIANSGNAQEVVSIGNGFGTLDDFSARRWQQGNGYRTDFTDYSSKDHVFRNVPSNHDPYNVSGISNTWKVYQYQNPDFPAGSAWGGAPANTIGGTSSVESPNTYTLSYIPRPENGTGQISSGGAGGTGDMHISPNINGPTSTDYKVDTVTGATNATWFTTITWGSNIGITTNTAYSTGGPSTQNNDTQNSIAAPTPLPYTVPWKSRTATVPSQIRLQAQTVPYHNGINFAERDNLFQQLKAISTVQASTLKDGAGFDQSNPWVNQTKIWTARQAYLTTSQELETGLISKVTVTDNAQSTAGALAQSYFTLSAPTDEGRNSYNRDWQNFYEYYKAWLLPGAYYTAIEQTLATDRQTHPLSSQTAAYDKEDFEPVVKMIEGPSLIATDPDDGSQYNKLVRTFEDLVYSYYKISDNSDAYIRLSEYFQVILYESPELRLYQITPENMPWRFKNNSASATRNGQDIHWQFDQPMYTGTTYGLVFYVSMDTAKANDPNMYYPFQVFSYVDLNLKTLTRDANDNLIRLRIKKNFPYSYIQGIGTSTPSILNDIEPVATEEGQIIGIFPHLTGNTVLAENLPIPYYTQSPMSSKAPTKLVEENVDEGTDQKTVPITGSAGIVTMLIVAFLAIISIYVKRKSNRS